MATCNCSGCPHPANCRCRCETCRREAQPPAPPVPVGLLERLREVERHLFDRAQHARTGSNAELRYYADAQAVSQAIAALRSPSPEPPVSDMREALVDRLSEMAGLAVFGVPENGRYAQVLHDAIAALRQPVSPAPESREALVEQFDLFIGWYREHFGMHNGMLAEVRAALASPAARREEPGHVMRPEGWRPAEQYPQPSLRATVAEWRYMQEQERTWAAEATENHDGANAHAHNKAARVYLQCAEALERLLPTEDA
jgi:hypothetical protein